MSGFERVKDFVRWMREVQANLGGLDAPKEALSLVDGSPMLLQRRGSDYDVLRPAGPGDKSPIYLNINSVLTTTVKVSNEASLYGASAARIEAAKASPFPLEDGAFALAPNASAWTDGGADWTLAAAPKQRIDDIRSALTDAGARPGDAFAMVAGKPMTMREQRPPRLILATSAIALAAAATAAFSLNYGAASIEGAAQNRLSEARRALADAEALAAAAETRREEAAGPLRQAQIVGATLDRAPSVVGRLAALAEATPDNAYIKRLNMGPELISGEFIAPDAAALAVKIGDVPVFSSARLKGAARAEAETLQRATLEISPRVSE